MRVQGRFLVSTVGSMLTFMVSAALAVTPLPNPPFTGGGFVPPDKDTGKAEDSIAAALSKFGPAYPACIAKVVSGLFAAAGDAAKVAKANAGFTACVAKVNVTFDAARDKAVAKGTLPACLGATQIDALRTSLVTQIGLLTPIVNCEAGGGTDPTSGFKIPGTKDILGAEAAVTKTAVKAGSAVGACFRKTVQGIFKAAGDGAKITAALTAHDACVAQASAKGTAGIQKVVGTGTLPSCLPGATAQTLVNAAVALGGAFTDEISCAQ